MVREGEILGMFPDFMRGLWGRAAKQAAHLQEIRLRAEKPVILRLEHNECFLSEDGRFTYEQREAHCVSARELEAFLKHVCHYSLYAYEDELKQGFLTVPGGHRIGVAGRVVTDGRGGISSMKHISCLNIRISHELPGIADRVLPFLYNNGCFLNSMIVSPPGCGKTTLLRDIVRQVSNGNSYAKGLTVGVVDERSEIAGSYLGRPQNDVGIRTDVLDACPKALGMMMLIRSMAPRVVAVDEIGGEADMHSLQQVLQCGSSLLVTAHGSGIEELARKQALSGMLKQKEFKRFILLGRREGRCVTEGIYDEEYRPCSG